VFIASGEDVETLMSFDNLSLPLVKTKLQETVATTVTERKAEVEQTQASQSLRGELQNLSDQEIRARKEVETIFHESGIPKEDIYEHPMAVFGMMRSFQLVNTEHQH